MRPLHLSRSLDFGAAASIELTITGAGFLANLSADAVSVGGAPCAVTASSETSITCTIEVGQRAVERRPLRLALSEIMAF